VVAGPLVREARRGGTIVALAAHVTGLLAGAAVSATALLATRTVLGPLPRLVVAAIAVLALVGMAVEPHIGVPGSRWMVPKQWARLTTTGYAGAFGLLLGAGIVTLPPSAAIYAVLATAQAAPVSWQTFVVLLGFGTAAAVAPTLLTVRSIVGNSHPIGDVALVCAWAARAARAELVACAALAAELLLGR
jgi:hypothetical protein